MDSGTALICIGAISIGVFATHLILQGGIFPFGNSSISGSVNDTFLPKEPQQNDTMHSIELRNGRVLHCRTIRKAPCGLMLSGCYNNAKYDCVEGMEI